MSRTCTRCQQAVPDGDLLCACQVVTSMSADVIARVRALAADFESRGDFATASDLLALCTAYAQVTAERDAAREAFDNLSTLQQTDRKELLDTRHALATLRADLAAQVEGMLEVHTAKCVKDAEEFLYEPLDSVCTCFATAHNLAITQVLTLLRGPHAD